MRQEIIAKHKDRKGYSKITSELNHVVSTVEAIVRNRKQRMVILKIF